MTDFTFLSKKIARDVFKLPRYIKDKTQRLELKGGIYPGKETSLGGLCEDALVDVIKRSLEEHERSVIGILSQQPTP